MIQRCCQSFYPTDLKLSLHLKFHLNMANLISIVTDFSGIASAPGLIYETYKCWWTRVGRVFKCIVILLCFRPQAPSPLVLFCPSSYPMCPFVPVSIRNANKTTNDKRMVFLFMIQDEKSVQSVHCWLWAFSIFTLETGEIGGQSGEGSSGIHSHLLERSC